MKSMSNMADKKLTVPENYRSDNIHSFQLLQDRSHNQNAGGGSSYKPHLISNSTPVHVGPTKNIENKDR
jgi:hypothetical protein